MNKEKVNIDNKYITEGKEYSDYRSLINDLLSQNQTTGADDSPKMLEYTRLNVQRMKKWDKTLVLSDELINTVGNITKDQDWLVITEGWCGDASQNIPLIFKAAELNEHVKLRFVLRDENLELMDQFLTNGGRSIPKLIVSDAAEGSILGTWGPRPKPMQDLLNELKSKGSFSYDEFAITSHTWYAKDKSKTFQRELIDLLS